MSERRTWPLNGLALAVLWLFVRGPSLSVTRFAEELIIGLGVGMTLAYSVRRFYAPRVDVSGGLTSFPYAVVYVALFVYELLTANLEVAYRVLHPDCPIDPDVVELPLRVRSDLAITTIANSITLTPGTLTMDYDSDRNSLYVHSLAGTPAEVAAPIRRWEDYALVIFDEELDPGDPVPEPDRTTGSPADSSSTGDRGGGDDDGR
ncbi:cation transporter [Halobacteriales archaeon QS_8_69_26]|nr:MAG: cation transporter [Halobacteriales archaeon QS_8_69_26]